MTAKEPDTKQLRFGQPIAALLTNHFKVLLESLVDLNRLGGFFCFKYVNFKKLRVIQEYWMFQKKKNPTFIFSNLCHLRKWFPAVGRAALSRAHQKNPGNGRKILNCESKTVANNTERSCKRGIRNNVD